MISDPLAVFLVLAVVVYVSLRLEERFNACRSLGAALIGILLGLLLTNTGVIPGDSPTYDFLMGTGVNIAIVLILLSVDLRSIAKAGPTMLAAFGIGAVGTTLGALVGAWLFSPLVGPETWKLAGQFAGSYTGGGVNFAAVGRALETSNDLFTAGIAADVVVTALWMAACLVAPVVVGSIRRRKQTPASVETKPAVDGTEKGTPTGDVLTLEKALMSSGRPVPIADAAALVAIAVGAVGLSEWLGASLSFLPSVLWLTTLVLLAAQIPAVQRLVGGAVWGNYLLLLFLASNGAKSVIANIFAVGPAVFYFALVTVAIHGLVIFGVGLAFRLPVATLAVASQANVGGAASAVAMASARGYSECVLPGVAVGLLGYAIGNYSGFAVAMLLRDLLA